MGHKKALSKVFSRSLSTHVDDKKNAAADTTTSPAASLSLSKTYLLYLFLLYTYALESSSAIW